jgi:Methyltransferase domain
MIDPAIESHYGTGYERARLFPGGKPTLEFVRSLELLERLLPAPPAAVLDVGGGPGTYATPLAARGYRVHLVDPVPLRGEWADPRRREHILFAARATETEPSLAGFSNHLIAAATKPPGLDTGEPL